MGHRIQIGQMWRKEDTDEFFLVTRIYVEALATIAVLRRTGAENEGILKVKVARTPKGQWLPGFSIDNDAEAKEI